MIKNLDDLARFVKGGAEVLQKAQASEEEVTIELNEGQLVTDEGIESLKVVKKTEHVGMGKDFIIKDLKELSKMPEYEGKKPEMFLEKYKEHILSESSIEPQKALKDSQNSLQRLQETYDTDINIKDGTIKSLKGEVQGMKNNEIVFQSMPDVKGIKKSQAVALFNMEHSLIMEDDKVIVSKNGERQVDKYEKPIPLKDFTESFAKVNGWLGIEGKGEGDKGGSGTPTEFKTSNEVMAHCEANNIDPNSAEAQVLLESIN